MSSLNLTPLTFLQKVKQFIADNLVAGSNITLTTDADNKVTIATTGGGGGGGISWDGSTANGVATFKDADEAQLKQILLLMVQL